MDYPTWLHIGRLGLLGCGTVPTSLPKVDSDLGVEKATFWLL